MKPLTCLALASFFVLATGERAQTASEQLPSVDLPPPLDRVLRDYEKTWKAGDPAAVANLFAEDGFVLSSDKPPVRGRTAIKEIYKGAGGDLRLRALAFHTEGATGFIVGAYHYGEGKNDQGKFTLTLKKGEDERWLIFSDMDNGNGRRG